MFPHRTKHFAIKQKINQILKNIPCFRQNLVEAAEKRSYLLSRKMLGFSLQANKAGKTVGDLNDNLSS